MIIGSLKIYHLVLVVIIKLGILSQLNLLETNTYQFNVIATNSFNDTKTADITLIVDKSALTFTALEDNSSVSLNMYFELDDLDYLDDCI